MNQHKEYIWITGASSGLGYQLSCQYARAGATVIISSRNQNSLLELVAKYPDNLIPLACDVTNESHMSVLGTEMSKHVPYLDRVILNAGVCEYIDLPDIDVAKVKAMIETNYFGSVNSVKAAMPLLKKAPTRGQIVGISSLSTLVGLPRAEAYGASKAAVNYFLESLRIDLANELDVVIVNPGFIDTPLTQANDFPMPFIMSAERAAIVIVNKLQKKPMYINFPIKLYSLLQVAKKMPTLWYRFLGPKLSRAKLTQVKAQNS